LKKKEKKEEENNEDNNEENENNDENIDENLNDKKEEYDPYLSKNKDQDKKVEKKVEVFDTIHNQVQQECIIAIRTLMNHRAGIDAFIKSKRSIPMISRVLETENKKTKQQLFFLLSSCSLYSEDGFFLALEIINHFKLAKKEKNRFDTIVKTLKLLNEVNEQETPLIVAIMMFFNTLLKSVKDVRTKNILKKEFKDLGILLIVEKKLEKEDQLEHHIMIQLSCFFGSNGIK